MVSETSLPINQEVVRLPTKVGIYCRDFISKISLDLCRALFLGVGCLRNALKNRKKQCIVAKIYQNFVLSTRQIGVNDHWD